jgi:hypothetical protein
VIVCTRCGRENLDHYKFCLGCGAELSRGRAAVGHGIGMPAPAGGLHAESRTEQSLVSAVQNALGTDVEQAPTPVSVGALDRRDGMAFAPTPAPVEALAEPCPSCGSPVPRDFVFCGQCGHRMAGAKPAAAVQPAAPPAVAARGQLVLIRPDGTEGGSISIHDGETLIGRTGGPLFEQDVYLSPRHATLTLGEDYLLVADLGSLNGVFVRMIDEEEVESKEMFRIGQELLRFDAIEQPAPVPDGTDLMGSPNPGFWGRLSVVVGRDQLGSAFPLFGDAVVLGRERGDILFPEDGYVSGTHARLSQRAGKFYLADLGSSNGTFVRIRSDRAVKSGAFILMGQQLFRVTYRNTP